MSDDKPKTAWQDENGPQKPTPMFNVQVKIFSNEFSPDNCIMAAREVTVVVQDESESAALLKAIESAQSRMLS